MIKLSVFLFKLPLFIHCQVSFAAFSSVCLRCCPFTALDFQFFQSGFRLFMPVLLTALHTVHFYHHAGFPDDLSLTTSCVLLQAVTLILNYIFHTHQTPSSFTCFHIQSVHIESWVHSLVDGDSFACTPVNLL